MSCIGTTAGVVNVTEKALLEGVRYGSERRIGRVNRWQRVETNPNDVESEVDISLVTNLGETCLPPRWHPAYRRRESDLGVNVERGKLRPRNCVRGDLRSHRSREEDPQAKKSARGRVPWRGMQWRTVP